ncbi:BLUF domain-containing protein [uncultured Polaribacter sp.]|uniref:BLUF domain-containing protein n=1 Tax=uncultured Polaribacter sp. TaxID=174711 RepID=UPI0026371B86|nr:BLUF domain-containing protein [uncultured Polaribacter sp.]
MLINTLNAIDSLRSISAKLNGNFVESSYGGFLTFKNNCGKGTAKAFQLFSGLEVVTVNIQSEKQIVLENLYTGKNCLHFIFCAEGNLFHHFDDSLEKQTISRLQNVIVESYQNRSSKIVIEKNAKVKFSIITIVEIDTLSTEMNIGSKLSELLSNVLSNLNKTEEYAYFGEISNKAAVHVETLINTNLSGLSNILINEAAVFKILAEQYSSHSKDIESLDNLNPLSKCDTLKIIQLSEYISHNLSENICLDKLCDLSGLNKKKIQKGFQFFFDETVNKFISNLRVLKAKELLENSDHTVSEIVYKIGLNSRSYFSKIFYNKYGLLPTEYRKYHHIANPTFEIVYSSKAKENITKEDLQSILDPSKKKNESLGISSCLVYHKNSFYQILEGPKKEVLNLVEKIKKDERNSNLSVLYSGIKSGRTFKEWSMSLVQGEFSIDGKPEDNFDAFKVDFLPHTDMKNLLAIKYMWEKARNYLIVQQQRTYS